MRRLHPLSIILLALWLSSAAIFLPHPVWLAGVLVLTLLFRGMLLGFTWQIWLRQFIRLLPLFAAIMLIQVLFFKDGRLLLGSGWYGIHSEGLEGGVLFCLRLLVLLYSAQILIKLTYEDFDLAFSTLRMPEELGFMLFYALHTIPASGLRIAHYRQLLTIRGLDMRKLPLRQKLHIYNRISLSILADVLSRSAVQAIALDLRGFRSAGVRTRLAKRSMTYRDGILLAALTLLTCAYFILV